MKILGRVRLEIEGCRFCERIFRFREAIGFKLIWQHDHDGNKFYQMENLDNNASKEIFTEFYIFAIYNYKNCLT